MATTLKKLLKLIDAEIATTFQHDSNNPQMDGYLSALEWVKKQAAIQETSTKPADSKKKFIEWYCDQYKSAGLGTLLITSWPKEMKIAQRILALPLEKPELARRVQVFLNDKESDWIRGKARTMGLFLAMVNNYELKVFAQRHEKVALNGTATYVKRSTYTCPDCKKMHPIEEACNG